MRFAFTAEQQELAKRVQAFVTARIAPAVREGDRAALRAIRADVTAASLDVDGFLAALRAVAADGELAGDLEIVRTVPPARADRGNPAARCLSAAIRRHGGRPRPTLKTGTSDMNTVTAEGWTMPMAAYGPGDSSLDHGDDEHIELDEYLRGVAVLTGALDEMREIIPAGGDRAEVAPTG